MAEDGAAPPALWADGEGAAARELWRSCEPAPGPRWVEGVRLLCEL